MMNMIEVQEALRSVSDDQLKSYVTSPPSHVPQFLALAELNRRRRMQTPPKDVGPRSTTTVAQDMLTDKSDHAGLASIPGKMRPPPPANPVRGFADGGLVDFPDRTTDLTTLSDEQLRDIFENPYKYNIPETKVMRELSRRRHERARSIRLEATEDAEEPGGIVSITPPEAPKRIPQDPIRDLAISGERYPFSPVERPDEYPTTLPWVSRTRERIPGRDMPREDLYGREDLGALGDFADPGVARRFEPTPAEIMSGRGISYEEFRDFADRFFTKERGDAVGSRRGRRAPNRGLSPTEFYRLFESPQGRGGQMSRRGERASVPAPVGTPYVPIDVGRNVPGYLEDDPELAGRASSPVAVTPAGVPVPPRKPIDIDATMAAGRRAGPSGMAALAPMPTDAARLLKEEMENAKKLNQQNAWMRLAEFGARMAASQSPYVLQAAGEAGTAVAPAVIQDANRARATRMANLRALAAQEAKQQELQLKRGQLEAERERIGVARDRNRILEIQAMKEPEKMQLAKWLSENLGIDTREAFTIINTDPARAAYYEEKIKLDWAEAYNDAIQTLEANFVLSSDPEKLQAAKEGVRKRFQISTPKPKGTLTKSKDGKWVYK